MKKIYIVLMTAITLLAVSCRKPEFTGEDGMKEAPLEVLKVKGSLSGLTKSTLGDDGLTLKWTADDKIALWSRYMTTWDAIEQKGDQMYPESEGWVDEHYGPIKMLLSTVDAISEYAPVQGVLPIDPSTVGASVASFSSSKSVNEWFSQGKGTDDDMYIFGALYPAPEDPLTFGAWQQPLNPDEDEVPTAISFRQPYVMVNVPSVQDGKHYDKYQRLIDTGFNPIPYPGAYVPLVGEPDVRINGLATRKEIVEGDYTLDFSSFVPVTSLLSFTLRADVPEGETYQIDHMDITVEMRWGGQDYKSGYYALSGTVPLFLLFDETHEKYLCNTFEAPYDTHRTLEESSVWEPMQNASTTVRLDFHDSPVTVSSTATSADDPFYAVVIPTHLSYNLTEYDRIPHLKFVAYDPDGIVILKRTLAMDKTWTFTYHEGESTEEVRTVYPGIKKGTKYSFDLSLKPVTPPAEALSGQFSLSPTTKAYIARSNLWAYVSNGSRDTSVGTNGWKLAEHQYDIVGTAADWANFGTYSGWIDLFGFSTTANDHGISVSTDDSDYSGDASGWTDCMAASGWRTITADEGVYLFMERTNALNLFAYATVYVGSENSPVQGLVFLPDDWETPSGCSFTPVSSIGYNFDGNTYNADNASSGTCGSWEAMEAEGAVFWPVAGVRIGTTAASYHEDFGNHVGAYWSGSADENYEKKGCLLLFGETNFNPDGYPRTYGGCVRLVRDVTE